MDWVKLYTSYFDDIAIATGTDAAEVMFTRGIAHVGRAETGGFIAAEQLHALTRRPAQARKIAEQLTRPAPNGDEGPWVKVVGGYRIRNWGRLQEELETLLQRRESDRRRKQRQRERDRLVTGQSRDKARDCHATESKREKKTAAAAAEDAAAAADQLPTTVAILRDRLQAHTALQALRFDGLDPDRLEHLEQLIAVHGDQRLVDTALRTLRTPPPVHVSAFLGTWAALPEPGQRLRVVETDCDLHPGQPAARCSGCAADRLAGDA
jgi:hypothetical protein